MDEAELFCVVGRSGSMQAMKLAWEMLRARRVEDEPEPDSFSLFDGIIPRFGELSPYRRGD